MKTEAPSLLPIGDAEWPPAVAHLLHDFAGRLNVYRTMAHHPALLVAWETLRNHVVLQSELTGRQRELVILRTGHRWKSAYEWAHHVERGLAAGLYMDEIEAARGALPGALQDEVERTLLLAVDQLLDAGAIGDAALHVLYRMLGKQAVLDVMATVGMYSTLAFLLNTFRTPLEPGFQTAGRGEP